MVGSGLGIRRFYFKASWWHFLAICSGWITESLCISVCSSLTWEELNEMISRCLDGQNQSDFRDLSLQLTCSPSCLMLLLSCWAGSNSFVTPWTVGCQALLSMGFPRQDYWSRLPFPSPGDLPDPEMEPKSPALAAGVFTAEPSFAEAP